jgi:hypothetical protein
VLPTSTSDPTVEPIEGATYVAESATAEAALAEVHAHLGPDARILDARRVLRGGVGGFFSREVVQLHAAAGSSAPAVPAVPATAAPDVGAPVTNPVTAVAPIDRLLAGAEDTEETVDFATYLRDQLTRTEPRPPAAASAAPAPAPAAGAAPLPSDRGEGTSDDEGPRWSETALVRIGLPPELVRSIVLSEPPDDVAWTAGLAAALRPLCRPLPAGRSLLVGPRARGLAKALHVPVVGVGQPIRGRGDAAAAIGGGAAGQAWLGKVARSGAGRWLHLVVGGSGWRPLLHADPLAVSWASAADLPEAIRTAVELGLVLGYGPLDGGVRRARPLDVALAVRDLVPGR